MFIESEFINIPGGDYLIGLSAEILEKASNKLQNSTVKKEFLASSFPEHTVNVKTVLIRKFLTTCKEFSDFNVETGYMTEGEKDGWGWIWQDERWQKKSGVSWKLPFGSADDDRNRLDDDTPVMQVSWNDAAAYCTWLSGKAGIQARLPREVEWEVFARQCGVPGVDECAEGVFHAPKQEPVPEAVRIGIREGRNNSIGILWEWMEDWYEGYPGGMDHRDYGTVYKVLRGGSLLSLPVQRTREFRLRKCPTARSPYYGFRIAYDGTM